jgi:hypothetical protein
MSILRQVPRRRLFLLTAVCAALLAPLASAGAAGTKQPAAKRQPRPLDHKVRFNKSGTAVQITIKVAGMPIAKIVHSKSGDGEHTTSTRFFDDAGVERHELQHEGTRNGQRFFISVDEDWDGRKIRIATAYGKSQLEVTTGPRSAPLIIQRDRLPELK